MLESGISDCIEMHGIGIPTETLNLAIRENKTNYVPTEALTKELFVMPDAARLGQIRVYPYLIAVAM